VSVGAFLSELNRRDIQVWSDGDQLRCNAPSGALTPVLRDQLRERKLEIVRFLRSAETSARQERAVVPLQPAGSRTPVFAVGGHNGDIFCYRALAEHLGSAQPFFGLEPPGLDGQGEPITSVEELAGYFAAQVRTFQPVGSCVIAGYCAGGAIAFELARQLVEQGARVSMIALFAGRYPTWFGRLPQMRHQVLRYTDRLTTHARELTSLTFDERRRYFAGFVRRLAASSHQRPPIDESVLLLRRRVEQATMVGIRRYKPRYFPGRLELFLPSKRARRSAEGLLRWQPHASVVREHCGPAGCAGDEMLLEPHVAVIADLFRRCCDEQQPGTHLT
jgi:thioesterase domain-containing protein